jgi:hypothetical protein
MDWNGGGEAGVGGLFDAYEMISVRDVGHSLQVFTAQRLR